MSGCLKCLRQGMAWQALQATPLLAVLAHARLRAGVMAPAQVNWLNLVGRRLSHVPHELRHPLHVKACGVRDHTAAVALKQPIPSSKETCHAV